MGALARIDAWGFVSQGEMRPDRVVFLLLEPDDSFGEVTGVELVDAQAFVWRFPVGGLNESVLPGLPWRNESPALFH